MSDLNEFAINLPMTQVAPTVAPVVPTVAPEYDITANTAIPADVNANECKHINVSVDSASVTNYDPHEPMVCVDLVLNVNITEDGHDGGIGKTSTYKIVKRLSMDRVKLALQAEHMQPYQVLEDQDDPAEVEKMMAEFYAAQRARELVGLPESKGDKSFKVLFSFDDESEAMKAAKEAGATYKARGSNTITIKDVKDAAHARHVFNVKHAHQYKNPKITRATEIKQA